MINFKAVLFALLALTLSAIPATAAVTVTTPINGSTVATQFALNASASSCSSQPIAAMGYSFDNSTNTLIFQSTSISTTATTTAGAHVLHVKAWGNAGAVCVADISLNVSTGASTVSVTTPTAGATVTAPFALSASAPSCSSQTVAAMGYSFDDSTNTLIFQSTSINTTASTTAGAHVLHVKAWGNAGAVCVKDVSITVATTTTAPSSSSTPILTVNSSSLSFGSVNLNTPTTQTLTLSSSGTSAVTISGITITGTGFTYSGASSPLTLNPGQSATIYVVFNPTTAGSVTGKLTIASNSSTGSQTSVALSGTGQSATHQVALNWQAPTSSPVPVTGYLVLRAVSGGSYQQINSSTVTQTTFVDSSVQSGTTYTYEVESVSSSGATSQPSNVASAVIP